MLPAINIEFHGKNLSDFQLKRIIRALDQPYSAPVTAYLSDVFVSSSLAVGVVFGHTKKGPYERYSDGHIIQISDIQNVRKEGRFWAVTTETEEYVIASFRRGMGRTSLRALIDALGLNHPVP